MTQVKSININTTFDKKTVKDHMNKPLVNIHGVVESSIEVPTKHGASTGFKGDFVATNCLTGEVYESNAAFLPKGLTKDIEKQLAARPGEDIHFSACIKATESDKNTQGYAWIADGIETEARQKRRAALMAAAMADAPKALAAPKAKPEAAKK